MRLEAEGVPDPANRGAAEAALFGHAAPAPMSRVSGKLFQGGGHHLLHLLVADLAGSPASGFIEETSETSLDVAGAPLADCVVVDPQLPRQRGAGKAVCTAQDDAGRLSQSVAGLGTLVHRRSTSRSWWRRASTSARRRKSDFRWVRRASSEAADGVEECERHGGGA
jgi:hypothetical protein